MERHHVVPLSLGGLNIKSNITVLTAREHFICHLLLTKMTEGLNRRSMCYALHRMTYSKNKYQQKRYQPSSKMYEIVSKINSQLQSEKQRGKKFTEEHRKNISKVVRGRIFTDESRERMSKSRKGKMTKFYTEERRKEVAERMKIVWSKRKAGLISLPNFKKKDR